MIVLNQIKYNLDTKTKTNAAVSKYLKNLAHYIFYNQCVNICHDFEVTSGKNERGELTFEF